LPLPASHIIPPSHLVNNQQAGTRKGVPCIAASTQHVCPFPFHSLSFPPKEAMTARGEGTDSVNLLSNVPPPPKLMDCRTGAGALLNNGAIV